MSVPLQRSLSFDKEQVMKQDGKNMALESDAALVDVPEETADGFNPLKAILRVFLARYEGYEVCLDPLVKTLS